MPHTLESLLDAGRRGEMTAEELWQAVTTVDRSTWEREDYEELTSLFLSLGGAEGSEAQRSAWEPRRAAFPPPGGGAGGAPRPRPDGGRGHVRGRPEPAAGMDRPGIAGRAP